jgi:hypothetical protein
MTQMNTDAEAGSFTRFQSVPIRAHLWLNVFRLSSSDLGVLAFAFDLKR